MQILVRNFKSCAAWIQTLSIISKHKSPNDIYSFGLDFIYINSNVWIIILINFSYETQNTLDKSYKLSDVYFSLHTKKIVIVFLIILLSCSKIFKI